MHISQNPDTTKRLLHSLELAHYRNQFIATGVIFLIFGTILFLREPAIGIMVTIMILPVLIFYLFRIWQIFRRRDSYIFCKVALSEPHHNFWAKAMYFTVVIDHPEIGKRARQTRPIFQTHGIVPPLMEDYVNQAVTVAYNPATDALVVIG